MSFNLEKIIINNLEVTRNEKNNTKNYFFDTPTEKSCHHCPNLTKEQKYYLNKKK